MHHFIRAAVSFGFFALADVSPASAETPVEKLQKEIATADVAKFVQNIETVLAQNDDPAPLQLFLDMIE